MILVRDVFQARYGKADELVALFNELRENLAADYAYRILTDVTGTFFTVVAETELESLAAWEELTSDLFAMPEFADWFARMTPLVESGRREFYQVVK